MTSNTLETLVRRAELLKKTRQFFDERGVLEVETPLLYLSFSTDPYVLPFHANYKEIDGQEQRLYLQSSPENCMKRLVGKVEQSIFQICKAFRNGETGPQHNPEFTILEWYRVGYSYTQLGVEVAEFLKEFLGIKKEIKVTYCELFEQYFNFNPLTVRLATIKEIVSKHEFYELPKHANKEQSLDLLLDELIRLHYSEADTLLLIYDYPAWQSQMAAIHPQNDSLVQRFECYVGGIELANGYQELNDAAEQKKRFKRDNQKRQSLGLESIPEDGAYLKTLHTSFPYCAGVALGLDRLLMLLSRKKTIQDIMPFSYRNL